jgi:hypothetical protein
VRLHAEVNEASNFIRALASLAWPVFALVVVLLFRSQITDLISSGMRRFKAGPFEVEWDRQLSEAEAELDQPGVPPPPAAGAGPLSEELAGVARAAPAAGVMEAHAHVGRELRQLLTEDGATDEALRTGAAGLARQAGKRGLITEETARAIEGLTVLRNLAAHGRAGEVSVERATEYLVLADAVLFALGHRPEGGRPE